MISGRKFGPRIVSSNGGGVGGGGCAWGSGCFLVNGLPYAHLYWLQIQFDSPARSTFPYHLDHVLMLCFCHSCGCRRVIHKHTEKIRSVFYLFCSSSKQLQIQPAVKLFGSQRWKNWKFELGRLGSATVMNLLNAYVR